MTEKRLIDVDARIAEIKKACCINCENYNGIKCRSCWVDDAIGLIDGASTVDAIEVVRCRECEYFDEHTSKCHVFSDNEYIVQLEVDSDHFCSYGERRIDNA